MTTESNQRQYRGPLFISLIIHGIVFCLFFLGLQFSPSKPPVPFQSANNVVKAVTVNQAQVEQEISKIQEQKQQEQQQKLAEQEKMQKQLDEFRQKQKQEQAKLEKLKQNLKQQQEKQIAEQKAQEKKLADLKEQQTKEAERLTKIKQEQQAQAQKLKEQQKLAEKEKQKPVEKKQPDKLAQKSVTTKTKDKKALDDILKDIEKEDAEKEAASSKKKSLKDLSKNQKQEKDDLEELISSNEMQGEVDKYKSLILRAIGQRWRIPENADPSLSCKLLIKLGSGGVVLDVRVVESSGDPLLDRSAVLAVQKASPLPVPEMKDVFNKFREFKLTVRPESILSSA